MEEMRAAVERFCALVESDNGGDRGFPDQLKASLAELLACLGRMDRDYDVDPEYDVPEVADDEKCFAIGDMIDRDKDFYCFVYDPIAAASNRRPKLAGSFLGGDLVDIWSKLKPTLDIVDGPHRGDALFTWDGDGGGYYGDWPHAAARVLYVLTHSNEY